MSRGFCFAILLLSALSAFGQTGSVSGRVIDSETNEGLPFANVFVNNTTLGTATSVEGDFTIKNIPIGSTELVFSFVGYQTYQTRIIIKDGEDLRLNIKLVPQKELLTEVQIKGTRDKAWERQVKKFEKIFLGADALGRQCTILNPYVIDFPETKDGSFIASAIKPIEIENNALGYKVHYYLRSFTSDGDSYAIVGNARFEEMKAKDAEEAVRWFNNRKEAYLGSARHLFKSILGNHVAEEGFRLYASPPTTATVRAKVFAQELDKTTTPFKASEVVSAGNGVNDRKLSLGTRLEVHYVNKAAVRPAYTDVGHSVSWLDMKGGSIRVNTEGVLLTPLDVVFSGDMSLARISNMLPLDYQLQAVVRVKSAREVEVRRMYEKTYVHLSKSFYYPGEVVWFKAYMRYAVPEMIDTLSQTLYVDLVDENRLIVQSKTLKIDRMGTAAGNFVLPSAMKAGKYALVAYTNWMRNFGSKTYFVKPLPVLDIYERIIPGTPAKVENSRDLEVAFDQEKYSQRQLVKVSLKLEDEFERPLPASLSVSVTDAAQVPQSTWMREDITTSLDIPQVVELPAGKFGYRVEYGVTWKGEFTSDEKKKVKTDLTIVRGAFDEVKKITTAENGTFELNDLEIQDSVSFSFQALRKGVLYGQITPRNRDIPFVEFKASDYNIPIERKDNVQRILSTYEIPRDAILLEGVEVKSTRLMDTERQTTNLMGKGDAVINGEDIRRAGSMETLLRMKAPGFRLFHNGLHWYLIHIRGEATLPPAIANESGSQNFDRFPEPVLAIDNMVQIISSGESVGDRLMNLRIDNIDRVEVSSVSSSFTGSQGGYGLVAVFLNKGVPPDKSQFHTLYVKGFNTPGDFRGPDYGTPIEEHSQADYRSTVYWSQNVMVNVHGQGEFSFYTADLPGKYRVVIEGMTGLGKPLHIEKFIEVVSK